MFIFSRFCGFEKNRKLCTSVSKMIIIIYIFFLVGEGGARLNNDKGKERESEKKYK